MELKKIDEFNLMSIPEGFYFTRGITDGKYIYALEPDHLYSKIGHERLLLH